MTQEKRKTKALALIHMISGEGETWKGQDMSTSRIIVQEFDAAMDEVKFKDMRAAAIDIFGDERGIDLIQSDKDELTIEKNGEEVAVLKAKGKKIRVLKGSAYNEFSNEIDNLVSDLEG